MITARLSRKWRVRFGLPAGPIRVMTHRTYEIVRGTVLLVIALSIMGWFLVRCLKRSEDPARLMFK